MCTSPRVALAPPVIGWVIALASAGCAVPTPAAGPADSCGGKCDSSGTPVEDAVAEIQGTTLATATSQEGYDFIVVGSGAGGGPLASRLARAGFETLLLEAGELDADKLVYQLPGFHALSTEDPDMSWEYFVEHHGEEGDVRDGNLACAGANGGANLCERAADGSLAPDEDPLGIFYPRAGTLGGCTAHNAMITVYPHQSDWDGIHRLFAGGPGYDGSWASGPMRRMFERLERKAYSAGGDEGHGLDGWLQTEHVSPALLPYFGDRQAAGVIWGAARAMNARQGGISAFDEATDVLWNDVNRPGKERDLASELFSIPLARREGRRASVVELIVDTVQQGYPLTVKTRALVTNVVFDAERDEGEPRAVGVQFLDGRHLYEASPQSPSADDSPLPTKHFARIRHVGGGGSDDAPRGEVILSAGAFNTPQLLMLSGIGPEEHLRGVGIEGMPTRYASTDAEEITTEPGLLDLPGVGSNLQDRYEVGVVHELRNRDTGEARPFPLIERCAFDTEARRDYLGPDGQERYLDICHNDPSPYQSNGALLAMTRRSSVTLPDPGIDPDLFLFAVPGPFRGYYPGYSSDGIARDNRHKLTWLILKGHTKNRAGRVRLRDRDPRVRPDIHFQSYSEGGDSDARAVVDGVEFVREVREKTNDSLVASNWFLEDYEMVETWPGGDVQGEELEQWVRDESWGHHACCTAAIGRDDDPDSVLDQDFRVRGVKGLRVVDASVFPDIPGFFIVTPIYMISEKAAQAIIEEYRGNEITNHFLFNEG